MKTLLVYLLVFLLAFIAITGLVIIMDSQYENIFDLNFAARKSSSPSESKVAKKKVVLTPTDYGELKQYIDENFKNSVIDSLDKKYFETKTDTVYKVIVKDSSLIKYLNEAKEVNKSLATKLLQKNAEVDSLKSKTSTGVNKEKNYDEWLKTTVSLYESMDVRKAAKLISSYSDNEARDIIYSMKKKKAAEILAQLSAETVQRITRSK